MIAVFLSPFYLLMNGYLLWRSLLWLGVCYEGFQRRGVMITVSVLYSCLALALLIAMFLPQGELKRQVKLIGNYWLGIMMYLSLAVILADLARLVLKYRSKPAWSATGHIGLHRAAGAICLLFVLGISIYGLYTSRQIRTTSYEVKVTKAGGNLTGLNIVLAADLHMGYNIGCAQIGDMVKKINEQHPDLVVFAGDLFDNEYEALEDPARLAKLLRGIESTYGVYAVYGNHDIEEKILAGFTFGGKGEKVSHEQMDQLLADADIRLLRDEYVMIADSVYLYGRPDHDRPGRGIEERKTPRELAAQMDMSRPVIVLDHQPKELQELADVGVDLDLCGHTHDGQMLPGKLLTDRMWENSCGYLKKGNMHNIVTSGVGIFGPNMRVGTKAEICSIRVRFE